MLPGAGFKTSDFVKEKLGGGAVVERLTNSIPDALGMQRAKKTSTEIAIDAVQGAGAGGGVITYPQSVKTHDFQPAEGMPHAAYQRRECNPTLQFDRNSTPFWQQRI